MTEHLFLQLKFDVYIKAFSCVSGYPLCATNCRSKHKNTCNKMEAK